MKDVHPLFVCVLGSFLLIGCGNKQASTESLHPDENAALSQRLEPSQRPILIEAKAFKPFLRSEQDIGSDVSGFRKYIHQNDRAALLKLRTKLQLKPDQLLVIGQGQSSGTLILSDFLQNDLFASANDLVINHVRSLKTPTIGEGKGEFETTEQYQQRQQAEQAKLKKITANLHVDIGRLEDALNYLSAPIRFKVNTTSQGGFANYDADRQLVYLQSLSPTDGYMKHPPTLNLVFSASPENAELIINQLKNDFNERNRLGFVFRMQQGQLLIDRLIVYQSDVDDSYYSSVMTIDPVQLYLAESVVGRADDAQQPAVLPFPLKQKLPFQFGFKHYHDPDLSKPEPVLASRALTVDEVTQLSLGMTASEAEGQQ